jgi:glycerol-3-phosphate acyltransferase PlsY
MDREPCSSILVELSQLPRWLGISPVLIVCAAGLVMAALRWRKYVRANALIAFGVIFMAMAAISYAFVPRYLLRMEYYQCWGDDEIKLAGISITLLHASAIGLLLGAVFVGRRHPSTSEADTNQPKPNPAAQSTCAPE